MYYSFLIHSSADGHLGCFHILAISKVKRQPSEWEKIIADEATDKQLISKIYKQLLQLNSRKINDPIKKWAKELNRHFSKEDIHMANKLKSFCTARKTINEMRRQPLEREKIFTNEPADKQLMQLNIKTKQNKSMSLLVERTSKKVLVQCMILDAWGWCTEMTQRDGMRREEGGDSEWGTHVCLWRIHVDVWQNQYNIVK